MDLSGFFVSVVSFLSPNPGYSDSSVSGIVFNKPVMKGQNSNLCLSWDILVQLNQTGGRTEKHSADYHILPPSLELRKHSVTTNQI